MYQITSKAMTLLFRLMMILSLASNSFSSAIGAMHPEDAPLNYNIETDHPPFDVKQYTIVQANEHGDHDSSKKARNSCCKDYCSVAAITCSGSSLSHPRVVSLLEFVDDPDAISQATSPHRPPNI